MKGDGAASAPLCKRYYLTGITPPAPGQLCKYHHVPTQHNEIERFGVDYLYRQASRDLDLDLTQADDITLDDDADEGFKDLGVTALVSLSEHMETFGMRALSLDDEGDDGEEM